MEGGWTGAFKAVCPEEWTIAGGALIDWREVGQGRLRQSTWENGPLQAMDQMYVIRKGRGHG